MAGLVAGGCIVHRRGLRAVFSLGCQNRWGANFECDVCDSAGGESDRCCAVGRNDHVANAVVWNIDFDGSICFSPPSDHAIATPRGNKKLRA